MSYYLKRYPAWLWASLLALPIRIPLLFLPNPGRNEAAYFYWSQHFEPAYAFLMQIIVHIFQLLPVPDLLAMRLPALLIGLLVIFLFDWLLQLRGINYQFRFLALILFAFSPWQSNFGVLLNPDNFLMAAILLLLIAIINGRPLHSAVFAGLAVLAKPTGILIMPAALYILYIDRKLSVARKWAYGGVALAITLPAMLSINADMLNSMFEFGKMEPSMGSLEAFILQLLLLILGGGPLLIFYAAVGFNQRLKNSHSLNNLGLENKASLFISALMLIFYGTALIFNSQVKYNWLLPAVIILMPNKPISLRKVVLISGIILSIGLGVFQNVAKVNPKIIAEVENTIPKLKSTFGMKGGIRESKVTTSDSWTEHFLEYRNMDKFAREVTEIWYRGVQNSMSIRWIVCDDYGLASQLVFALDNKDVQMIIPNDGIFHRTVPEPDRKLTGGILVIAVHRDIHSVWKRIEHISQIYNIHHPVSDQLITIGILD